MKALIRFGLLLSLSSLGLVACAANAQDDDGAEVGQTEDPLTVVATTSCKSSQGVYWYEHEVTIQKLGWGSNLTFLFDGNSNSRKNDAFGTVRHHNARTAMYKTADDIPNGVSTTRDLQWISGSSEDHSLRYGDVIEINASFDEPWGVDPACSTTMKVPGVCRGSNAVCTGSYQCCTGICESNCPYPGCGHSCR